MPAGVTANDALSEVRLHTGPLHERLERRIQLLRTPSRSYYARYLARTFGTVSAAEEAMLRSRELSGRLNDLAERGGKVGALAQDLGELGIGCQTLPAAPLPAARDLSELLGILYVMEGSTLGGVVLARHLEDALGPLPTRYLRFYGAATAAKWRAFTAVLNGLSSPGDRVRAAAHARRTFEVVEAWLEAAELLSPRDRS